MMLHLRSDHLASANRLIKLVLLAIAANCQKQDLNRQLRIIGGQKVDSGTYPWFASLDGCGGSLISPRWVITAAHCKLTGPIKVGHLCDDEGNCGQALEKFDINTRIIHPGYSSDRHTHDFALLKLDRTSKISYANIDTEYLSNNYNEKRLWTAGFGDTDPGQEMKPSSFLIDVEVDYVGENKCSDAYGKNIDDSMICAASPGKDSCQGDSGGPLYDKEEKTLVGLVSWGGGCAQEGFPGVYARISHELSWIRNVVCRDEPESTQPKFCKSDTYFSFASSTYTSNNTTLSLTSDNDEKFCITASGKSSKLELKKCKSGSASQLFFHDDNGCIKSKKYRSQCIMAKNGTNLRLSQCSNEVGKLSDQLILRSLDNYLTMNTRKGVRIIGFSTKLNRGIRIKLTKQTDKSHKFKWLLLY